MVTGLRLSVKCCPSPICSVIVGPELGKLRLSSAGCLPISSTCGELWMKTGRPVGEGSSCSSCLHRPGNSLSFWHQQVGSGCGSSGLLHFTAPEGGSRSPPQGPCTYQAAPILRGPVLAPGTPRPSSGVPVTQGPLLRDLSPWGAPSKLPSSVL